MPIKDPEARKAYQKEYAKRNKEKAYAKVKEWRADNPEAWKEQRQRYAKKHPDVVSDKRKRWRNRNLEQVKVKERATAKEYRTLNSVKVKTSKAEYAKRSSHIVNAAVARRRASKTRQTPIWVGSDELWLIQEIYDLARLRTKMHGFSWHVDHIVPLQGELVSGLHVPNNLQAIPANENIRKYNKYEVG